jgi:Cytochrome P460
MKAIRFAAVGIVVTACSVAVVRQASVGASAQDTLSSGKSAVDSEGHLHVPSDYRRAYQLLGSWAIAADDGRGSKELHIVYSSPGTIDSYRKNKRFPDGAVLIKEVFKTATNEMTTGTVSRADALKGRFVMVKDNTNRYPGNALWGDGWGWSWFDADNSTKTTSTDYRLNCKSCHVPAQATDWIYVDGYPPLNH